MIDDRDSTDNTQSGGRNGRVILRVLLAAFCVYVIAEIAVNRDARQWDFRSYYHAAEIDAIGGNPYDMRALNQRVDGATVPPFVYPPLTLTFFRVFAMFDFDTAYLVWYVFKLLLTLVLIFVWWRYLFRDSSPDLFAWFVLLAFGGTLYIDLLTGNITMLEQVLIWIGMVALLRERLLIFCVAIVLASMFKITPLLFLLLLPLLGTHRGWHYAIGSAIVFIAICGISYGFDAGPWHEFYRSVQMADEPGRMGNPSTLALSREIIAIVSQKTGLALGSAVSYVLYVIIGLFALGMTLPYLRKLRQSVQPDKALILVFLACLVFAILMPRFKTYSFILVIPASLFVLTRAGNLKPLGLLFAILVLTTSVPFPVSPFIQVFWRYYPLLLVFAVWGFLLRDIGRMELAGARESVVS